MTPLIMKKGFTLLEVMIAISVLTLAVGGCFALLSQVFSASSLAFSKLVAVYLAQEGVENVRNIRDSNWLSDVAWNNGLPEGESNEDVKINDTPSKFKRKTTITNKDDYLDILVNISWQEKATPQSVEVREYLYNWYGQ